MDLVILGLRIKERRKRLGLSQQKLADLVGYRGKDMISRVENGQVNVSMDKVVEIARALNCLPSDLLGEPETRNFFKELIAEVQELNDEDKETILKMAQTMRSARQWQARSGTDKDGE